MQITKMGDSEASVASLLAKYEEALNQSNTDAVMKLYASDGVFMPQNFPSSIGTDAVRRAYEMVFNNIKLSVKFTVAEIVDMTSDWAFARTNSAGTVTVNATGTKSAEANQELFIFKRDDNKQWKIARYCFSTTNPPRAEESKAA